MGFGLVCAGVIIETYRHTHGAAEMSAISLSSPGVLVALAGLAAVAAGVLIALSLTVLAGAPTAEVVVRRGAALSVGWVALCSLAVGSLTYAATGDLTLGHRSHDDAVATAPSATATSIPGATERVALSGTLTLDGAPFDAPFLGARVLRDGAAGAACQLDITDVVNGRYQLTVMSDIEARGCGAPGASIVLWTTVDDVYLFSVEALPWLGASGVMRYDAAFSSSAPEGASPPATELYGIVSDDDGSRLGPGTVVEAYIGDVRCGIASIRYVGYDGYSLAVAGPSVAGCDVGTTVHFRIDGRPASQTAVNDLARGSGARQLDLSVR